MIMNRTVLLMFILQIKQILSGNTGLILNKSYTRQIWKIVDLIDKLYKKIVFILSLAYILNHSFSSGIFYPLIFKYIFVFMSIKIQPTDE